MPKRQKIYIYEHPESKIRFLETALVGQDWRATIVCPTDDGLADVHMREIQRNLEARGYGVQPDTDGKGHAALSIHHFGKGTRPTSILRELGLVRGTAKIITNPGIALAEYVEGGQKAAHWVGDTIHDPARTNGLINTTAEVFLTAAGAGAQYGKFTDTKNALQSIAGLAFMGQSLSYLFLAKNNEDHAADKIKAKLAKTDIASADITHLTYDANRDAEPTGVGHRALAFLKKYAVQVGAVSNNLGSLAYVAHAFYERKFRRTQIIANPQGEKEIKMVEDAIRYVGTGAKGFKAWAKTGFGKDIIGSCLSFTGWSVLLASSKAPAPENDEPAGFGQRMWNKFCEKGSVIAGFITLGASSFRLMGAKDKRNKLQQTGETIYIGGDVAIMFTNADAYDGNGKLNVEKLSDSIMQQVNRMPVMLGNKAQQDFTNSTVQYWHDKECADEAAHHKEKPELRAALEENTAALKQTLLRKIHHQQSEQLEHLYALTADIAKLFSPSEQPQIITQLAEKLAAQPWLKATAEEVTAGITAAYPPQTNAVPLAAQVAEKIIAQAVAQMGAVVPTHMMAATTAAIYDVIATHLQTVNKPNAQASLAQPSATVHQATVAAPRVAAAPALAIAHA